MKTILAMNDVTESIKNWRLCLYMSIMETRRRFRRTVLGPFWEAIGLGVLIGTLGLVYTGLWHTEIKIYLPFLCAGKLIWNAFSSIIHEGSGVFVQAGGVIREMRIPFNIFVFNTVLRNLISMAHCSIIFIIVVLLFSVPVNLNTLLVIPGLILFTINVGWITLLIGMLCARFRDMQPMIVNLLQISFFLTPIVWMPENLSNPLYTVILIKINPIFNLIDLVRSPLLGKAPALACWPYVICMAIIGWTCALGVFSHFRNRIIFWL